MGDFLYIHLFAEAQRGPFIKISACSQVKKVIVAGYFYPFIKIKISVIASIHVPDDTTISTVADTDCAAVPEPPLRVKPAFQSRSRRYHFKG